MTNRNNIYTNDYKGQGYKERKKESERENREKRKRKTFMNIANVKSVFRQKLIKNRTQLN